MTLEITDVIKRRNPVALRQSGTNLTVLYPSELIDQLGLKKGDRLEAYYNHRGEFLVRPVRTEGEKGKE